MKNVKINEKLNDISFAQNSVTAIGSHAFANCTSLLSIDLGNALTAISDNAFSGCTGLTAVKLPDSLKKVKE